MNFWPFPKLSFKFLYNFLLIDFAVKLIVLNLLTFEQMNNKRACKSKKTFGDYGEFICKV